MEKINEAKKAMNREKNLQVILEQNDAKSLSGGKGNILSALEKLRREVVNGLLYTHTRANDNTGKNVEVASFCYALIELLNEKGIITIDELDRSKEIVGQRLANQYRQKGIGIIFQDPEYDKYSFKEKATVDCFSRIHICGGACCRIPFALSKQDLREGVIRWDLGRPYLIDHGQDGYCNHIDRNTFDCTVYEYRPVPCRAFDCREDRRIWHDFSRMKLNPEVRRADWPQCLVPKDDN
jgi:Fe-S-cluster containining protein